MAAEPEEFGRAEALGEPIRYHVMGADVLWEDLLRWVEPPNIMQFKCDVSRFASDLVGCGEIDCRLIVL